MALSLLVIPGYTFSENERVTQTKLNQLGRPTIELQGALAGSAIAPGSITSDKLSPNLIVGLSGADPGPANGDLLMIHDFSANGLRKTTIGEVLALSTPTLTQISAVTLKDYAWIIEAQGGANRKATLEDTLREAVNGQTQLATPTEVDPAADTLLLHDASAPVGSNRNRKATVNVAVKVVTNTLIVDAGPLVGPVDPVNDELLLRDASTGTQVKVKVKEILGTGIGAWGNFNGDTATVPVSNSWNATSDVIILATTTNLEAGDVIWFETGNTDVTAFTAYFVYPVNATTLQLYRTKAGALAQDAADRVGLTLDFPTNNGPRFTMWGTAVNIKLNPIVGGANFAAVIRSSNSAGFYRVYFNTPLPNANYGILATAGRMQPSGTAIVAMIDLQPGNVPTTTSFGLRTQDDDGGDKVANKVCFSIFHS